MTIKHKHISDAFRDVGLSGAEAARRSGIPYPTLRAVLYGRNKLSLQRASKLVDVVLAAAASRGVSIRLAVDDIPHRTVLEHDVVEQAFAG